MDRRSPTAIFAAGFATASAASVLYRLATSASQPKPNPAPTETFPPKGSPLEVGNLPYPPDLIPGARDVPTPYGTIRCYEWGPADAERKVLLVHGISGACPALLGCAERFASKGCRVMMLDLFGRGWSGGPSDLPYDGRLFCSQILMALATSPIPWTGREAGRFSMVGYSLGGCISVEFTSWFPRLVQDLVLVAPAGLMRPSDWRISILNSGVLPQSVAGRLLARRLYKSPNIVNKPQPKRAAEVTESISGPLPDETLAQRASQLDSMDVVDWQMKNNVGFLHAMIHSLQEAPSRGQQGRWRLIGERCEEFRKARVLGASEASEDIEKQGLSSGQVLLCVGRNDSVIKTDELLPDAEASMGELNFEVRSFEDAGHEVGMTKGVEIADYALDFWQQKASM